MHVDMAVVEEGGQVEKEHIREIPPELLGKKREGEKVSSQELEAEKQKGEEDPFGGELKKIFWWNSSSFLKDWSVPPVNSFDLCALNYYAPSHELLRLITKLE
ncbi:hypothetical protein VNO77_22536 [Canavalia gladiata]|uniref:Uncharacterized protein n=1 Tax=Canavalia gladiata TaxID=3824 RepID=A0AAN9Q835_CANGL